MIRARAVVHLAWAGALLLVLGGCISLLPKTEPAQLYRFGSAQGQVRPPPPAAVAVFWSGGVFQREAADDRILTIRDQHAAYIADTRWVAPAQVLFEQAVFDAFEAKSQRVRLVARGTPATTDSVLRLDVRNFETRYDAGPRAAPTVLVRVHAVLSRRDHSAVLDRVFEARAPASDNRVRAIVAAYDQAVRQVLDQIIAWSDQAMT